MRNTTDRHRPTTGGKRLFRTQATRPDRRVTTYRRDESRPALSRPAPDRCIYLARATHYVYRGAPPSEPLPRRPRELTRRNRTRARDRRPGSLPSSPPRAQQMRSTGIGNAGPRVLYLYVGNAARARSIDNRRIERFVYLDGFESTSIRK